MKNKLPTTNKSIIHAWKESPKTVLVQIPKFGEFPLTIEAAEHLLEELSEVLCAEREEVAFNSY
jgi:hypothetical protein